jgi:hypothetical protein
MLAAVAITPSPRPCLRLRRGGLPPIAGRAVHAEEEGKVYV